MEIGHHQVLPQTASSAVTATTATQVALNSSRVNDPTADLVANPGAMDSPGGGFQPFGSDGFGFDDFLDIINPLQHVPIVNTFYRQLTGDTIEGGPRILGGTLFGGPIGGGLAIADVMIKEGTGEYLGDHVYAAAFGEDGPDDPQLADAETADALPGDFETAAGTSDERGSFRQDSGLSWQESVIAGFESAQDPVVSSQGAPALNQARDAQGIPHVTMPRHPELAAGQAMPWYAGAVEGLRKAEAEADAALAQLRERTEAAEQRRKDSSAKAPPGAIAPGGGGFSDAMLGALIQAQEQGFVQPRTLGVAPPARTVGAASGSHTG